MLLLWENIWFFFLIQKSKFATVKTKGKKIISHSIWFVIDVLYSVLWYAWVHVTQCACSSIQIKVFEKKSNMVVFNSLMLRWYLMLFHSKCKWIPLFRIISHNFIKKWKIFRIKSNFHDFSNEIPKCLRK